MSMAQESGIICDICGKSGARIDYVSRCYGKGDNLIVIKDVPVIRCQHCGERYLTAQTLHEIARIRLHCRPRAASRSVPIAKFPLSDNRSEAQERTARQWSQVKYMPIRSLKGVGIPAGAGFALTPPALGCKPSRWRNKDSNIRRFVERTGRHGIQCKNLESLS